MRRASPLGERSRPATTARWGAEAVAMVTNVAIPETAASGRQTAGAGDPLLASKVTVPGVPEWLIPRPRIQALIAQGADGPVTALTGPPGAGKTMALAL